MSLCAQPAFAASAPLLARAGANLSSSRTTPPRPPFALPSSVSLHMSANDTVTVVDYGAGNVRSLENAVRSLGFDVKWARSREDIAAADKLIFPGVGSFGAAMKNLTARGFVDPLREYLAAEKPFLGICIGLQTLFDGSDESPGVEGLGVLKGTVRKFRGAPGITVPLIGWNTITPRRDTLLIPQDDASARARYYFVHSFRVGLDDVDENVVLSTSMHGEEYASSVQCGKMCATQFHPEKSGRAGLRLIENFLTTGDISATPGRSAGKLFVPRSGDEGLAKRVVACLDVRENDSGDLVVTKGDQYDVREKFADGGDVRNLGKPVELARRYYEEGADEVCFLNITSFRGEPVGSAPMIEVLERTSEGVFVPLCIGGGIRDYTDRDGTSYTALDVANLYFRAGADKISLGSDAVYAAEAFISSGGKKTGTTAIETISHVYGAQAVVISVDPTRVYVKSEAEAGTHATVTLPDGRMCWYQCTVKGGREGRDIDVVQLVTACEALGAGEILINSMDADGQKQGFDLELISMIRDAVTIPVIASSGAGKPSHFTECFDVTGAEAALAAGIFHRNEVSIEEVKAHMAEHGTLVRASTPHVSPSAT
jgi:imidazole glycerol-phosphate synthase